MLDRRLPYERGDLVGRDLLQQSLDDQTAEMPGGGDYSLTELGHEPAVQIRAPALWTNDGLDRVEKARQNYDTAKGRS